MDLEIIFGVPKNQRFRVAKIIYEAFENKFGNVFGSKKSIPLISKYLRNDRTVVAISEDVVVGVAGLKFEGKEFIDIGFWQLLRELKLGIFRATFLGWIFFDKVEDKELLVDTLAVAESMRGKGIGTSLINFTIDFARSKGFEQIKIFVVDINPKAKRLYERIGFKQVKIHRIPFPWNKVFGFENASELVYVEHQITSL
jgi:ribosomal protein S18 acetylase RimI-like enzyme